MKVLVAYASRHGATAGIAERIARTLERQGLDVSLERADRTTGLAGYDGYVIGSAAYLGHWQKDATQLVRRGRKTLSGRPVWLFSSGPIGDALVDEQGRDVTVTSRPAEFDEFRNSIHPRDERVFFGAYDPSAPPVGIVERLGAPFVRMAQEAIPKGDFRDWPAIEAWAEGIARDLQA